MLNTSYFALIRCHTRRKRKPFTKSHTTDADKDKSEGLYTFSLICYTIFAWLRSLIEFHVAEERIHFSMTWRIKRCQPNSRQMASGIWLNRTLAWTNYYKMFISASWVFHVNFCEVIMSGFLATVQPESDDVLSSRFRKRKKSNHCYQLITVWSSTTGNR